MLKACAAVVVASLLGAWAVQAAASSGGPAWKQIYEDGQSVYYVSTGGAPQPGEAEIESLIAFKVPQVVAGAQAWSMVSRMKLRCDQGQMLTVDNTFHAAKMGAGPLIQSQDAADTWHAPQPGSLGELVWNAVCGQK